MTTEELEFWADDALLREIRHKLVPEEMGVDTLGDACLQGVLFDNLPQSACRVGLVPIRFKEVGRPLLLLASEELL